jgi:hypothetical protein
MRRTRTFAALALAGTLVVAGTAPAWADSSPSPAPSSSTQVSVDGDQVTITRTRSLADVQQACARAAAAQQRLTTLQSRITGSATTTGSIAWLQAKEAAARSAGHTVQADRIATRVDRRTTREAEIVKRLAALSSRRSTVCSQIPAGS